MTSKTGLRAFAAGTAKRAESATGSGMPQAAALGRRRGTKATVALTVRLNRTQWERLHQLALSEGTSLQHLVMRGLGDLFRNKGLPTL